MSFIDPLYPIFLTTGFTVGFGHCIGMCGPIVLALPENQESKFQHMLGRLLYNFGRTVTYGLFGLFNLSTVVKTLIELIRYVCPPFIQNMVSILPLQRLWPAVCPIQAIAGS